MVATSSNPQLWQKLTIETIRELRAIFALEPSLTPTARVQVLTVAESLMGPSFDNATARWNTYKNCVRMLVAAAGDSYDESALFRAI